MYSPIANGSAVLSGLVEVVSYKIFELSWSGEGDTVALSKRALPVPSSNSNPSMSL